MISRNKTYWSRNKTLELTLEKVNAGTRLVSGQKKRLGGLNPENNCIRPLAFGVLFVERKITNNSNLVRSF